MTDIEELKRLNGNQADIICNLQEKEKMYLKELEENKNELNHYKSIHRTATAISFEYYNQNKKLQEVIEEYKSKIRKIIEEELPDDEIMKVCSMYDVNGIEIRRKLEQLLESEGLL